MEERSATDPFHASVLESLGFWVPTVVAHGRAFPGFPEATLASELGLPPPLKNLEATIAGVGATEDIFRLLLAVVPNLPKSLMDLRLAPERDRPFSQWVWHIFRFGDEVIHASAAGSMPAENLRKMSERKHWSEESAYPSFQAIAAYGEQTLARLSVWRQTLDEAMLEEAVDTPWGILPIDAVVMHLLRHSAIHIRQIVEKLWEIAPDARGLPSEADLANVPEYHTLDRD